MPESGSFAPFVLKDVGMRNAFRIWGATCFTLLYTVAVILGCFAPPKAWLQFDAGTEKNSIYEPVTAGQYTTPGIAPRTAFSAVAKTQDASASLPTGFVSRLQQLLEPRSITYSQYVTSFYNFSIRSRKADLIFPFHYFW
jgi:hypothetical protein